MADEIRVQWNMTFKKGNIDKRHSGNFTISPTGTNGPTPGVVAVSASGTDITLSQLTTPGVAEIKNISSSGYIEVGIYEPELAQFYPFMELAAGESYPLKFSRNLLEGWTSTGTTPANNRLHARNSSGTGYLEVSAYEA